MDTEETNTPNQPNNETMHSNNPIIPYISLCSGYEGIGLGLHRCIPNLRCVAYCEREAFAIANLVAKMESGLLDAAPVFTDVTNFPWADYAPYMAGGILSFGWPCQPVSCAGKRKATEDERWLFDIIADGISILRPGMLFAENVEGLLSASMPDGSSVFGHCIERLESLHYKVAAGIFSASEVGAPHQRKRVFILANLKCAGLERLYNWHTPSEQTEFVGADSRAGGQRSAWPSRPGEPQYTWEPPRVVANSHRIDRSAQAEGREHDSKIGQPSRRQTQPPLGECSDESPSILGQNLTFNPYGDNVNAYENVSKKISARQILFELWNEANSQTIQWTPRGLQCFLAEKILQSGMQLDGFTQRICFFVWCIQTGHEAQGFGLQGMWVYETSRNSSRRSEPIEQFKRELGYAMCQLSYEIALEGRQEAVEKTAIMQGVRHASERAWAMSQALPEMEEIWRSAFDQKVWEKGCYIEASGQGNRTDELRLLGNGVVPATAERAFRVLIQQLDTPPQTH